MALKEKLRNTSYFINSRSDCYFYNYIWSDNFIEVRFGRPIKKQITSITYIYEYK